MASTSRSSFGGIAAIRSTTSRRCFTPMPPRRTTRFRAAGRKLRLQVLEMVRALGEEERRPPFFESIEHVIDDELISRLVSDKRPIEILNGRLARIASNADLRLPDNQAVRKRPSSGLVLGIDGEADRPQLHFDDRMMPVAPLWSGGQTGQYFALTLDSTRSNDTAGTW